MRKIQERLADESTVENHLKNRIKMRKGQLIKIRLYRGWPDRIVMLPGGVLVFFELKRPVGGKFEPLQLRIHDKLRKLGFWVFVCNTKQSVDEALEEVCSKATLSGTECG